MAESWLKYTPASGTASGDDGKVYVTSNTSWTIS
jgi:hypothetical protein